MGFDNDGVITGMKVHVVADTGAYPAVGAVLTTFTQTMIQGVYAIPKIRYTADSVVTNTTTIAAYRGAGRPEATQMLERVLDVAAAEFGMDPAEIRHKNFIAPEAFPFTTLSGANYDNGEYAKVLDAALEEAGVGDLQSRAGRRREAGTTKELGIGLSTYVEVTAPAGLHVEYGKVEITPEGKVIGRVGTSAHGQGHITSFSMIIAEHLGVPMEDITILQSDTADIPRGSGTMGSRSLQTAGSAIYVASETVFKARSWRPRSSKRRPPTSSKRLVAWPWLAYRPQPCRGPSCTQRRWTKRNGLTAWSLASNTNSTSTVQIRPSRSALMCPSSRSTPRRARLRCCAMSPSTMRVGFSTRCWSPASSTAVSPRGWPRRSTRVSPTTTGATRSPRTSSTIRCALALRGDRARVAGDLQHRDADVPEPARSEGNRRVGHDRLDSGDPQCGARCALALRRPPYRDAAHPDEGVEGGRGGLIVAADREHGDHRHHGTAPCPLPT